MIFRYSNVNNLRYTAIRVPNLCWSCTKTRRGNSLTCSSQILWTVSIWIICTACYTFWRRNNSRAMRRLPYLNRAKSMKFIPVSLRISISILRFTTFPFCKLRLDICEIYLLRLLRYLWVLWFCSEHINWRETTSTYIWINSFSLTQICIFWIRWIFIFLLVLGWAIYLVRFWLKSVLSSWFFLSIFLIRFIYVLSILS